MSLNNDDDDDDDDDDVNDDDSLWEPSNIYGIGSFQRLEAGSANLRFRLLGFLTSVNSCCACCTVSRMSPSNNESTSFSSSSVYTSDHTDSFLN